VDLNFKTGWKRVSVPVPKWGPGATAVLTRWAKEMLSCDIYAKSKSPSASRPHIVRKSFSDAPKDVNIKDCGIRVCGDYRQANDQLQKSIPSAANGTDELVQLPRYLYTTGSQTVLACTMHMVSTPAPFAKFSLPIPSFIGLIEPTRMVFGEMIECTAGTVACANTPATLMFLPNNAHQRTAAYVDDHAQGSRTFPELLICKDTAIFSPYANNKTGR
jgi:hypothetical protein